MGLFSKKEKDEQSSAPVAAQPAKPAVPPPPGAPKAPMAPGMTPPKPPMGMTPPKPPMAPGMAPMGAPKPPMAPGMMPPPPMGMGANGPKPPMAPGMTPPPSPMGMGAPKPPMAPGMMPPPSPMGMGPSMPKPAMGNGMVPPPSPLGMGPMPGGPGFGSGPSNNFFAVNQTSMNVPSTDNGSALETILLSKKEYVPARSVVSNSKVTYDQFCRELTFEFFSSILQSQNLLEKKPTINKIKKTLLFVLLSTKDLPEAQRQIVFNAAVNFVDFLKAVVYYPDQQKVDDEVVAYLPYLKEVAFSFSKFLVRNR